MFRARRYNLPELYVFAAVCPRHGGSALVGAAAGGSGGPYSLCAHPLIVPRVSLRLEVVYLTYAIRQFSGRSLLECLSPVVTVLMVGQGVPGVC